MQKSLVIAAALVCAGCAVPQWKDRAGNPPTQRDALECENEGLKASGPGAAGVWTQVQVEQNCLRLRGYNPTR